MQHLPDQCPLSLPLSTSCMFVLYRAGTPSCGKIYGKCFSSFCLIGICSYFQLVYTLLDAVIAELYPDLATGEISPQ